MDRPPSDSEDELDKLTRTFEEQASQDLHRASQRELAAKPPKPKGMKEIRDEGLQAPVSEQSKGFMMLTQMGYKKGQGLGKNRDGREEPIDLMIKDKKTGLGMDEERKRKREEAEKAQALRDSKRQLMGNLMQKDFSQTQASRLADRRYEGQLKTSRKVAETLDVRKGLDPSFLWPPPEPQKPPEGDVAGETAPEEVKEPGWEEQPVRDKLLTVLTYLRSQHSYCLHCGCQYEGPDDLAANCPGLMDEDH